MADLLTAALDYAARGWHVFPLHPDSKRPARPGHRAADCVTGGYGGRDGTDPHCRDGHAGWEQRATTDAHRIRRAWSTTPCGIGIAAGPSQLVVIDLDTPKSGETAPTPWARFGPSSGAEVLELIAAAHHGRITPTWTVRTISGGTHLYYRAHEGVRFGNTAGTLGWLIDTRAHGGYVVAPPTPIAGHAYEVVDDRPAAPLPAWLAEALSQRQRPSYTATAWSQARETRPLRHASAYVAAALDGEARKVRDATPGRRNHTLFCAAVALGQLVAGGQLAEEQARDVLTEAAAGHISDDAFSPSECEATIRSGFATGTRNPRKAA